MLPLGQSVAFWDEGGALMMMAKEGEGLAFLPHA